MRIDNGLVGFDDVLVESRLGRLYRRYEPRWYMYEVYIMLRKLLVSLARVAFGDSPAMQAVATLVVLFFAVLLQIHARPYRYERYNRLEAGLPEDVPFIQKTGTQLERACHVGVIEPQDERRAIVVVTCAAIWLSWDGREPAR